MVPESIFPTKPPQKPIQNLSHKVQKAQKVQLPAGPRAGPSVPMATSREVVAKDTSQNKPKSQIQFQPPFKMDKMLPRKLFSAENMWDAGLILSCHKNLGMQNVSDAAGERIPRRAP